LLLSIATMLTPVIYPSFFGDYGRGLGLFETLVLLTRNSILINWVGFDATTCIDHVSKLGTPPSNFTDQARQLSEHVYSGNRESCRKFLSKHYSWLK
jgi:hypothetical protein